MSAVRWMRVKQVTSEALEYAGSDRSAWLAGTCAGDDALRGEVESLLTAHERAGGFLESAALLAGGAAEAVVQATGTHAVATPSLAGRAIGPYRIIRELGQGGMAVVYLAERADAAFDKEVAIKIVRGGPASALLRQRFFEERRILATLDHPNIARLIDGGTTDDGLPYVVMERVEGIALDAYCDARGLSLDRRLALFRAVCGAVQYAHQHLVIHRDLKARNILVTTDGTPKLLDFGIAKLMDPGLVPGDETQTSYRALTLEAASPEQVRGEPMAVTSDVFSLGVLLYRLVTGRSPYGVARRTDAELVRAICDEAPLPPSAAAPAGRQRALRGELDAIVLKAMRKEPPRRYASVQDLSEDIRRHLEGLPVGARKDTVGYRAGRFVRRHPLGIAASALIVVTLVSATVVTARQARIAERERMNAEARFNQVRALANAVLFDYHDGIAALPGSTTIRERMVKDALAYLDTLSAASSGDPAIERELASAYEKVGEVQGSSTRANLGNYPGAIASHGRALEIRTRLAAGAAPSAAARVELARSHSALGELSQVTGNLPGAVAHYGKAFALLDATTAATRDGRRALSLLHVRQGKAQAASGDLAPAIASYRKGIGIAFALAAEEPGDNPLKRDLAFAQIYLGDALEEAGDLPAALASQRSAFDLLRPLASATNAPSRRDMNTANGRIADVLSKQGDKRGALAIQRQAIVVSTELAGTDPSNALAARDLYIDYYKVAFLQEAVGDHEGAIANQRHCIALCEAQVAANPTSAQARGDLAVGYFRLGEMLEPNRPAEARESYEKSVAITDAMSRADPSDAVARGDLSEDYMKVADLSLRLGDRAEALRGYGQALAAREELVAANPESGEGFAQLARIQKQLGGYYQPVRASRGSTADWREARQWYQRSLDTFEGLRQRNKLTADYADEPGDVARRIRVCDAALLARK